MKKVFVFAQTFILLFAAVLPSGASAAPDAPQTSAGACVLYEAQSGDFLFADNADERLKIASTTKIMTALVVLSKCRTDEVVVIKPEYTGIEGSSMYLKAGEKLTVMDLLYGLLLPSGNDAAVALACHIAGSVSKFADMMNETAKSLGCKNTRFVNPHGLDAQDHYSSARDLAIITAKAMKNNVFCQVASTKTVTVANRVFTNHNKLLWSIDGMTGGKTGYTKSSGRSLVTCVERGGMKIVCVTLSDPNDWDDHTALYNWAFSEFKCLSISGSDLKYMMLPVISGTRDIVGTRPARDYTLLYTKDDSVSVEVLAPRFVYAGVIRGSRAGTIRVARNGKAVIELPLVFSESVPMDEAQRVFRWDKIMLTGRMANDFWI